MYEDDSNFSGLYQIPAGKMRRYSGQSLIQKVTDFETIFLNIRDLFKTVAGYRQAVKLIRKEKPEIILIKGGFVGVPVGLAAARLKVPFITHDSDSVPGLANRIISRWAKAHATGMPSQLYGYPKDKTFYTGIPVAKDFKKVDEKLRNTYKERLGLGHCKQIVTVIGGSQGGELLNKAIINISNKLINISDDLGIIHIAGERNLAKTRSEYEAVIKEGDKKRLLVTGFVKDPYLYTGAADIVISRASATVIAELALQSKPTIVVPGHLAGGHQHKNADYLVAKKAAVQVDQSKEDELFNTLKSLLENKKLREEIAMNFSLLAKPEAAKELALLLIKQTGKRD